jgi:protein-tyrosine-phosphatase
MSGRQRILDEVKRAEICALVTMGCSLRRVAQYVGCGRALTAKRGNAAESASPQVERVAPFSKLSAYVALRAAEFDDIPSKRKSTLQALAQYVAARKSAGETVKLTFICTHNSRRSQMAQLWAAVAAAHYGIDRVETFSGGTEVTAFNPRAVAALERAGFEIVKTDESTSASDTENPRYRVLFASRGQPLVCFSKKCDSIPISTADFCAVMTCSEADQNCPVIPGAAARISLPYVDPKLSDGTPEETATYDARSAQIACEMLYVFSLID